jgi:hypothetical protein
MTPVFILSVSRFVVPNRVETPPVVYLYNSTSATTFAFVFIERCNTHAHKPEGKFVTPGTPESVA